MQSLSVFDPDQLVEAVGSSSLMHTQLSRGSFSGSLLAARFGNVWLDSGCYSQTLISRGTFPSGRIVIGCLLDAKQSGCLNGYRFGRHDIVVFPDGAEMDYLLLGDTRWAAVQVSRSQLEDALQSRLRIRGVKVIPGSVAARFNIVGHIKRLLALVDSDPTRPDHLTPDQAEMFESMLFDDLCLLLESEWQDLETRALHSKSMQLLRRFRNLVDECPGRNQRVATIAQRLDVSPRTLEQTCRDYLGLSPKQYLVCLQLNAVHRELMHQTADSATVEWLARSHGISHLGRFSASYRELFGCNPSATLDKRFF